MYIAIYIGPAMAFHISDPKTDEAVRRLAQAKGKTLTETIREAVENEYNRTVPLAERLKPIQEHLAAIRKPSGKPADKAFYDDLSGDF
jgi:antitoxin VapB